MSTSLKARTHPALIAPEKVAARQGKPAPPGLLHGGRRGNE